MTRVAGLGLTLLARTEEDHVLVDELLRVDDLQQSTRAAAVPTLGDSALPDTPEEPSLPFCTLLLDSSQRELRF